MVEKTLFEGAATALVTPFDSLDRVDFGAFARMLDRQLEAGIDALVVGGTTGESAVLRDRELQALVSFAVVHVSGAVPVIAGTGCNDTARCAERNAMAARCGADGALMVTPYYNKTTQDGLKAHFRTLADRALLPLILYDVPSRTGLHMTPETCAELARHPNIAGLKAAAGDFSELARLRRMAPELDIWSGNDDQVVPLLALGGRGVISVVSNLLPGPVARMCRAFREGNIPEAAGIQLALQPLIEQLFAQVNPIPVKAACAMAGLCGEGLRLPLVPLEEPHRSRLRAEMGKWGLQSVNGKTLN